MSNDGAGTVSRGQHRSQGRHNPQLEDEPSEPLKYFSSGEKFKIKYGLKGVNLTGLSPVFYFVCVCVRECQVTSEAPKKHRCSPLGVAVLAGLGALPLPTVGKGARCAVPGAGCSPPPRLVAGTVPPLWPKQLPGASTEIPGW